MRKTCIERRKVSLVNDEIRKRIEDFEGGSHRKLCFIEKERGNVWKDCTERMTNEENEWDHNGGGNGVEVVAVE